MSNKIPVELRFNILTLLGAPTLLIPLFLLGTTIDPALTPRFTALSIALLYAVAFSFKDFRAAASTAQCSYLTRAIAIPLSVYCFCMILSLTHSLNISEGVFEILKTLLFLIVLLLATFTIRTRQGSLNTLAKGISILAVIVSVIAISQYYGIGFLWIPGSADAQPFSTFTNKNLFSSFVFLTIPFLVFGYYTFAAHWRYFAGLSIALAGYAILIAQTRAVWVALTVALGLVTAAVVAYVSKKRLRLNSENLPTVKVRTRELCAIVLVMMSLSFVPPVPFTASSTTNVTTVEKAASIFDAQNASRNERITLWKKSLLMIGDHPLLGVGAGNWKIAFPKYGLGGTRMETGRVHFPQPHNDFLWVASETGILGAVAYASFFLLGIFYCARIINKSDNLQDQILSLAMAFGVIGYLTISFFDFPKERIEHLVYVALILSAILATYDRLFPKQMKLPKKAVLGLYGLIVFVLASSTVVGLIRIHAEMHTRKALAAKQASEWDGVIREIDEAYSDCATLDPMVTPLPWYRGVANFSKNNIADALKDFEKAYTIHPYHIHVLNNLATCYEVSGQHLKAIELYSKALAISPRFEESLLNLTAVYFNLGKYVEAYQTILQCGDSKDPRAIEFLTAVKGKLNIR